MGKLLYSVILSLSLSLCSAQTVESIPFRARFSPTAGIATFWIRVVRDPSGAFVSASASGSLPSPARVKVNRGTTLIFEGEASGSSSLRPVPLSKTQFDQFQPGPLSVVLEASQAQQRAILEPADQAVLLALLNSPNSMETATGAIRLLATRDPRGRLTSAAVVLNATARFFNHASLKFGSVTTTLLDNAIIFQESGPLLEIPVNQPNADLVTALLRTPAEVELSLSPLAEGAPQLTGRLHGTDRSSFAAPASGAPVGINFYNLRNESGRVIAAHATIDEAPPSGIFTNLTAKLTSKSGQTVFEGIMFPSNSFPSIKISTQTQLDQLNDLVANPENFEFNGSPLAAPIPPPAANTILSAVWDPRHRAIAPGGLFTIFGRNLAKVPGDLAGLIGDRIPTTLNGTTVLMAGRPIPLIDVRADHIIAQVPADMPPGSQSVSVRTPSGSSIAIQAQVTPTAPAVFFSSTTPQGNLAAIQKANGTQVSMDNPARPNDVLIFYSSGFGTRSTGVIAPATPLVRTVNPQVTIGGRPAQVLYSVLVPGLVGIVQTAIRMPQAAGSGDLPLTISLGPDRANPVILYAALR